MIYQYVKVIANAKCSTFCGYGNDRRGKQYLCIKITQIASAGKANMGLIEFLSKMLCIAKSNIVILSGHTSSFKILQINNISNENFNTIVRQCIST